MRPSPESRSPRFRPCSKFIFNVRASYAQETMATLEYFQGLGVPVTGVWNNLISFDQNDTFGNAGYNGLVLAWQNYNNTGGMPSTITPTIARFRYTRNDDTSVPAQAGSAEAYLESLGSASMDVGVMMTDTYGAGSQFIQLLRQWQYTPGNMHTNLRLHFSNISFVSADALIADLVSAGSVDTGTGSMPYTQDVMVSEVVPNYQTTTAQIVATYNMLSKAAGQAPTFTALEGYIATNIFIQGLLNVSGPITPDSMIPALQSLPNLSLGLGATAGFSPTNHQYLDSVWGTTLNGDGSFKDTYYWTVDTSSAPLGTYMPFE